MIWKLTKRACVVLAALTMTIRVSFAQLGKIPDQLIGQNTSGELNTGIFARLAAFGAQKLVIGPGKRRLQHSPIPSGASATGHRQQTKPDPLLLQEKELNAADDAYDDGRYGEAAIAYQRYSNSLSHEQQYRLGYLCYTGQGTAHSVKLALDCWLHCESRYKEAIMALGVLYLNDLKQPAEALRYFEAASSQGDTLAQLQAAWMNGHGIGTAINLGKQTELLRQAATAGSVVAMEQLSAVYANSAKESQDIAQALQWAFRASRLGGHNYFNEAAEQGDAEALYVLAKYYAGEYGVRQADIDEPRNNQKALQFLLRGADKADPLCLTKLGLLYGAGGWGIKQDYSRALEYLQRAYANSHSPDVAGYIANFTYENTNTYSGHNKARKWAQIAKEAGNPFGYNVLAALECESGVGMQAFRLCSELDRYARTHYLNYSYLHGLYKEYSFQFQEHQPPLIAINH